MQFECAGPGRSWHGDVGPGWLVAALITCGPSRPCPGICALLTPPAVAADLSHIHHGPPCARSHARRHRPHRRYAWRHRDDHCERIGAVNSPLPMPVAERVLLACRRPVCALFFSLGTILGGYREPLFALHTGMCGSWTAGGVARCAGATRARSAGAAETMHFEIVRACMCGSGLV